MDDNLRKLVGIRDIQNALGISRATIYRRLDEGELEFIRIGGRILFSPDSINRYIDAHTCNRAPAAGR